MAGKLDLHIDVGADFRMSIRWYVKDDDGDPIPYDLDGATAWLSINGSLWNAALDIEGDEILVHLSADETTRLAFPSDYRIGVTFPSGDVRFPVAGKLIATRY